MAVYTVKPSGGDYSSLSSWEAAAPATLTDTYEAECDDFSLTDSLGVAGITTSAANYARVYTTSSSRHDGRSRSVSGHGFRLTQGVASVTTLRIGVNHLRLEGLEIEATNATSASPLNAVGSWPAGANDIRIDACIIHDVQTGTSYTCQVTGANLVLSITNTIIYGWKRTWDTRGSASVTATNCVLWRHAAQLGAVSGSELSVVNCYSGHASGSSNDWSPSGGAPTGNNNASSDTTAGTNFGSSLNSVAGSSVFVSVTPGAEDFTLKSGTNALVDTGTSNDAPADDIIGTSRPQGSAWDIGAFERALSGIALSGLMRVGIVALSLPASSTALRASGRVAAWSKSSANASSAITGAFAIRLSSRNGVDRTAALSVRAAARVTGRSIVERASALTAAAKTYLRAYSSLSADTELSGSISVKSSGKGIVSATAFLAAQCRQSLRASSAIARSALLAGLALMRSGASALITGPGALSAASRIRSMGRASTDAAAPLKALATTRLSAKAIISGPGALSARAIAILSGRSAMGAATNLKGKVEFSVVPRPVLAASADMTGRTSFFVAARGTTAISIMLSGVVRLMSWLSGRMTVSGDIVPPLDHASFVDAVLKQAYVEAAPRTVYISAQNRWRP